MRILITGATGFIGSALASALRANGHDVIACVHRTQIMNLPLGTRVQAVDYMRDLTPEAWLPRLAGVEVVINAVGILRESTRAKFAELHLLAPRALFRACEQQGVRRVLQISALGADETAISRYHLTKHAADKDLRASSLDWSIVQPSVVFGPCGASTRLFLRLASLPVIPLVGRGEQRLQPIHIGDLVALVAKIVENDQAIRQTLAAVGPQAITLRNLLGIYRRSLGLGRPFMLPVPLALIRLAARVGDLLKSGALSTETLHMLLRGNTGEVSGIQSILGYPPRAVDQFIQGGDAEVLRWRAVWSWLRPLMLGGMAIMWISGGVVSWLFAKDYSLALLTSLGLSPALATSALIIACTLNVALGMATLLTPGRNLWRLQLAVMVLYTLGLTWVAPTLWVDPFGPLVKNLPLAAMLLGLMAAPTEG